MTSPNLVPEGPDLKNEVEDTGLGGNVAGEGRVHHGMRGVLFLLCLAIVGALSVLLAQAAG
jgi:hypothetical protein